MKTYQLIVTVALASLLNCSEKSNKEEVNSTPQLEDTIATEVTVADTTSELAEISEEIDQLKAESEEIENEIDDLLNDL